PPRRAADAAVRRPEPCRALHPARPLLRPTRAFSLGVVMPKLAAAILLSLLGLAVLPSSAFAYVGPGAGLSALGWLAALAGAVGLAIVGFVWYPIRRLLRRTARKGSGSGR